MSGTVVGLIVGVFFTAPLVTIIGTASPLVIGTLVIGGIVVSAGVQTYLRQRELDAGERPRWWPLQSVPLATPRERAMRRLIRINLGVIGLAVGVMLVSVLQFHHPAGAIAGVPIIWLSVMVMLAITTKLSAAHYAALQQLRREGYRVCPGCEYDLQAQPPGPGVCPECGRAFDEAGLRERWERIYELLQRKPGP